MKRYFIHFFVLGTIFAILIQKIIVANIFSISSLLVLNLIILLIRSISNLKIEIKKFLSAFLIITISITIMFFRIEQTKTISKLQKFENQKIEIIGKVVGEPDIRSFNTRLTIKVQQIKNGNLILQGQEKMIISVSHFPEYKTADALKIVGTVKLPQNFENENQIVFNYVNYLAKDDIFSLMYYPKVELIDRPNSNFQRLIFEIKNHFLLQTQKILPSPQSELLGGILLGAKRSLGADLEEKFRTVGLIHIIVLSGYNVTIIAEFIFLLLSFLPKMISAGLGAISIVIFAVMVGSGATVIRSVIMALLALFAKVSSKNYNVNRALFFAGAIMILQNPQILLHDPSFQLSFLATIGLINLSHSVKKIFRFLPEKFQIREITSATFSTQIAVLPLLTKMTGELSIVAPIVNIITLQIIPITMLLGFITGLVAFLNQTLAMIVGFIPHLFLSYILLIVNFFSGFQFATIKLVF